MSWFFGLRKSPAEKTAVSPGSSRTYRSHKWILSNSGTLQINEDALRVFEEVEDQNCNMISIFGLARQGKSFLMNCLAGEKEIFTISNKMDPCTTGIDISDKWLNLSEFSAIDGGKRIAGQTSVGFIDAEGQGDQAVTYDAKLVCPILLASKCVIYNYKGELHKDKLLDTLGIMARAARNVGQEAAMSPGSKKFSHLHIIFRDWQFERDATTVQRAYKTIFGFEGTPEAETRDRVRQEILGSFASVRVWLFDAPANASGLREKLSIEKTIPEFRQQVREFRAALSEQLQEPLLFAGTGGSLTGRNVGPLMDAVVAALNRGESVLPQAAFTNMMMMEVQQLRVQLDRHMHEHSQAILAEIAFEANDPLLQMRTQQEAVSSLTASLNEMMVCFEEKKTEAIGDISGDLARQVLGDTDAEVARIRGNVEREFATAYTGFFITWLRAARQKAEELITQKLHDLSSNLKGYTDARVDHELTGLLQCATLSVQSPEGAGEEAVRDANTQLHRFFEMEAMRFRQDNQAKQAKEEARINHLLGQSSKRMEIELRDTAERLASLNAMGYPLLSLHTEFNKFGSQLVQDLELQAAGGPLEGTIQSRLNVHCESLWLRLCQLYESQRQSAFTQAVEWAQSVLEDRLVENKYKSIETVVRGLKAEALQRTRRWDDSATNKALSELDSVSHKLARQYQQQLQLQEQERQLQERQRQQEAEAQRQLQERQRQQEAEAKRQLQERQRQQEAEAKRQLLEREAEEESERQRQRRLDEVQQQLEQRRINDLARQLEDAQLASAAEEEEEDQEEEEEEPSAKPRRSGRKSSAPPTDGKENEKVTNKVGRRKSVAPSGAMSTPSVAEQLAMAAAFKETYAKQPAKDKKAPKARASLAPRTRGAPVVEEEEEEEEEVDLIAAAVAAEREKIRLRQQEATAQLTVAKATGKRGAKK